METQELDGIDSINQDELKDLLSFVALLRGYLNDHVVRELSETLATLSKLAVAISGTDLVNILEKSLQDPDLDKALLNPPRVGLIGMLRSMGDADVQRGMGVLRQVLKSLGKAAKPQ